MSPIDHHAMVQATPQNQPGVGSIPLSTLIEYSVQRTYHELTVLAELLPRKSDMERKIEICQFAHRTRQLFVRLLALVKWANSASKVDKCGAISSFLDNQAMLFVETADMLARMARETLVQARLPSFSLPCAIDVLTTGTYKRLPSCIKEKIVPPDPITPQEKRETFLRLNQIIEHRLVTIDLPLHMRKLKIENGRVRFHVEHEFEVTLTLMGDGPNIPWRLLNIEILVEDPETGDGKALVHSLQINYIHQLLQSRLLDNSRALHDLYNCLHSFCQSLQLEVLQSQARRLIHERIGDHIRIEDYQPGRCLVLSYWRDPQDSRLYAPTIYKLSIHTDDHDQSKPLQISHFPQIQGSESIRVAQAIKSDQLSIEKLVIHTIQVRTTANLKELERDFKYIVPGPCEIKDLPSVLYIPVIYPCMASEMLCIAVDIQKGTFLVSIGEKETPLTSDIEESLNADKRDLRKYLSQLRIWLGLRRCEKSIQHIQVPCHSQLPFIKLEGHQLENMSKDILFIKLAKQTNFYLVVEPFETKKRGIDYKFFLLQVAPVTFEKSFEENLDDTPKAYLQAGHMIELDTQACIHGPFSQVFEYEEEDPVSRKRKMYCGDMNEPQPKKMKHSSYFVPELTHVLALCEDRIPFIALGEELLSRNIAHQGIQVDSHGAGLSMSLIECLPCTKLEKRAAEALAKDLLHCKFRIHINRSRILKVESLFTNCPIQSNNYKEQSSTQRVHFAYDISGSESMEKVVQNLLNDWNALAQLYALVLDFAETYKSDPVLQNGIEVKTFTYKRLTLAYGPNKCYLVSVQYQISDDKFHLSFGTCGNSSLSNCHTIVLGQLERDLNETKSLAQLAQVLLDTWSPISAIGKLTNVAMNGILSRFTTPVPAFTIIPQSATHIRIIFRNVYCLDVHCRGGQLVAVRDGAYSMFDTSKVVEGLNPIPALKTFLHKHVDDWVSASQTRRRSTTEDDNPPSPIGMDTLDTFMSQQTHTGSPAQKMKQDPLRFPNPMTPPSNPTTPASPQTARMGQGVFLASPPPAGMMGAPSPGNFLGASSPTSSGLHVPSPSSFVPAPSPSSMGIHMPSPAANFISPAVGSIVSPPSRVLPQKSWAASVPTLLSHDAWNKLLTPTPGSMSGTNNIPYCPLERFLCCMATRKNIQKCIQAEDKLTSLPSNEIGVNLFKAESLQCKLSINTTTLQTSHLKLTPDTNSKWTWDPEELQVLEKYLETKVICPPYRQNTLTAFIKLLAAPTRILKDCIQILKLEMYPERDMKWSVQWCMTIPHGGSHIAPAGTVGMVISTKVLLMLQITKIGGDQTFVIPILHDTNANSTLIPEGKVQVPSPAYGPIVTLLKNFNQYYQSNECSIFPAVREMLKNLNIP